MPTHRVPSTEDQDDLTVLEDTIKKLETKGEEVVQVLPHWLSYPTGFWVVVTRKTKRAETRG